MTAQVTGAVAAAYTLWKVGEALFSSEATPASNAA